MHTFKRQKTFSMIRKLFLLLIISSFLITSCNNTSNTKPESEEYFTNPILPSGFNCQATFFDGKYYYTQETGDVILLWETEDITNLSEAKCKEIWNPKEEKEGKHNLWSPQIHRINDKWYIYYSADDGNTDNHQIYVLENVSQSPMDGEFRQKGPIKTNEECNWGIHASTFIHNNTQYLIWSGWPKRRIVEETQCIYIASMKNPWTLSSNRVMISKPEYSWERQWINPDGSRTAYPIYVNEAPTFFKSQDGDKLCIYYSASGCWTPYYCIGMLQCNSDSNLLDSLSWNKNHEPVFYLSETDSIYGPGHISFIPSPDNTEWYMLYHARSVPNGNVGGIELRSPRLQKISWDKNGMPVLGKPIKNKVKIKKPSRQDFT